MKTFARYLFSWPVGLLGVVVLLAFLAWFIVLRPTVYQNWITDHAVTELHTAGCQCNVHTFKIFDKTPILKYWNPEVKIVTGLTVPAGVKIPGHLLRNSAAFASLAVIDFLDSQPTDAEYDWAANLPNMQYIYIQGEHGITERGFQAKRSGKEYAISLSKVPDLETDLRNLASGPCPVSLLITKCQLSDECFVLLGKMKPLRQLSLTECEGITLEGLRQLQPLTLRSLFFRYFDKPEARLSDEMIAEIAKMKSLEQLILIDPEPMSEESIEALKTLPKLSLLLGPSNENRDKILHGHIAAP